MRSGRCLPSRCSCDVRTGDVRMKVALVAHWDWVLFNFRMPIARRLRAAGYEVVLICPPGRYVDRIRSEGFRLVSWGVDRRSFGPVREVAAIRELTNIYRKDRFDLTHHFTIKPNLYGTIAARRTGVPRVINTFSGMGFLMSEGPRAVALRVAAGPVLRAAFRTDSVWTVFQNEEDLASVVNRGWLNRERTRLIAGSGVDTDLYVPTRSATSSDLPVFLMAARLIKQKGLEDFVLAARMVRDQGVQARFVVAGEPDPGNPASFTHEQIDMWKKEGPVEFVGHVSDMPALLAASDVAVLPTYYPEGLPRFLLESASSGLPLIATDIPPCRPIVRDGHNGYLVAPRDPVALASAMADLAREPDLRSRFGDNGRQLVMDRFREQDVVDQYVTLYEELLGAGS